MLLVVYVFATGLRAVEFPGSRDVECDRGMGELERCIDGFGDSRASVVADDDAVHDDEEFLGLDVLFVVGEVGEGIADTIGVGAGEALREEYRGKLVQRASCRVDCCKELELCPDFFIGDSADDFFAARAFHGGATDWAGGLREGCEKRAEIAVAFRDGERVRLGGRFPVGGPDG